MFNWIDMKEQNRIDQLGYAYDEGKEQGLEQGIHKVASQAFEEGASFDFVQKITGLDMNTLRKIQSGVSSMD